VRQGSPPSELSQPVERCSLSLGERARVRGNRTADCIETAEGWQVLHLQGPFTLAFFSLDGSLLPADHGPGHEHCLSGGRDDLRRLGAGGRGRASAVGAWPDFVFARTEPEEQAS
jgi:hypothetical protein